MEQLAGVTVRDLRRVFCSPNGSFTFYVDLLCDTNGAPVVFLPPATLYVKAPGNRPNPPVPG
jgi:hypothetical protein